MIIHSGLLCLAAAAFCFLPACGLSGLNVFLWPLLWARIGEDYPNIFHQAKNVEIKNVFASRCLTKPNTKIVR